MAKKKPILNPKRPTEKRAGISEEEKKSIAAAIRTLDRIQPEFDKVFDTYDSAKVKCGLAAFVSGMAFLGVLSGNHEIQESIGTLGVGALPLIFMGSAIYFFQTRKMYHQKISEHNKAKKPLMDLGLSYTPIGRHFTQNRLIVLDSRQELDTDDFL